MKQIATWCLSIILLALIGCQQQWAYDAQRDLNYRITHDIPEDNYDVPAQVIYRIDDHRFISLENYDLCYGDNYYNDTQQKIHTKVTNGTDFKAFRGRYIVDDPSGVNVVIPAAPEWSCGDRGCNVPLYYSTDSGRTFRSMVYMNSSNPPKDSEAYTIAVMSNGFYVIEQQQYDAGVIKYPLVKNIDLNQPYPPGLHDISFMASKKPDFLLGLHSPSGQERFTCDASIRPSNTDTQK
jgi:hypothetical protein